VKAMSKQVKLDVFVKEPARKVIEQSEEAQKIYDLPEGWRWVKLNAVAEIIMGQSPPSTTYNKEGVGLPFYQGKKDFGERHPTPRIWCNKPQKVAKAGDVLISVRAPVGSVNICREKSCIGRGLAAIRPFNHSLDNLFLFHYLRSIENKWAGKGSTFKAIRKVELQNLPIPLPPLDEQRRIVSRLEQLIGRVEEAKKLRKVAKEETEKIMESAINKVFNKAEEKKWRWVKLNEICWINREKRDPTKEIPDKEFLYIDISSVEEGTGRIVKIKKILGKNAPSRARRVIHTNDVIMSTVRPYLKSFAIITEEYDNQICSTGFAVLSCQEKVIPKYLLYALFSDIVISQCNDMMVGAHYPALRLNQVAKIKIPLASLDEQKKIVTYLNKIRENVDSLRELQQSMDKELEKLVPSILDKAFRGEL